MSFNFKDTSNTYSKFEYIPKNSPIGIASDIPEVINRIKGNALDFSTKFNSDEFTKPILMKIANELESTARYFGAQQGLSDSRLLDKDNLYAEVFGNFINFVNRAQDDYGRFYAGHVEYGHYSKNRKTFVSARPFMRPALYAVSKSSQGEIANVLSEVLRGVFLEEGLDNLKFGSFLGNQNNRYSYSYDTVRGLLGTKIYESDEGYYKQDDKLFGKYMGNKRPNFVMTGKDFNTVPNFEKKMNKWSLKRYSGSKEQKRLRKNHGFDVTRRNPLRVKQNRDSLATPRRIEQARFHSNYHPVKREYNLGKSRRGMRYGKEKDSSTHHDFYQKETGIKKTDNHIRDGRKVSKYSISDTEKIRRASINPQKTYDKPLTIWPSYDKNSASKLRKHNYQSKLVVDKVKATKGYQKKYRPDKFTKKQKSSNNKINEKKQVVYIQYDRHMYEEEPNVRGRKTTMRPSELEGEFNKVYTDEGKEFYIPKEWGKKSR